MSTIHLHRTTTSTPEQFLAASTIVYLFLATLLYNILAGFLVFSERVAYPVYLGAASVFLVRYCGSAVRRRLDVDMRNDSLSRRGRHFEHALLSPQRPLEGVEVH